MRVVEADDLEPPLARRPARREVIDGIDQESCHPFVGDVASPEGFDDLVTAAEQ